MKKTFKYMLAALAVVTAASCAQELDDPNANPQNDVQLVPMTINVGTETRVTVSDDENALNWCDDDKIAIWDGVAFREFSVVEANGNTATFQGLVAEGSTKFSAVYPFEAAVSCDSEEVITATVPQAQPLDGGNVADNGIVAVCKFNKGENLAFKTATGYLRVDVSYNDVTEIIIDGAAIAGNAKFNADGTVNSVATASGSVSMTPAGEKFATGSYYVALLPGTTPAGDFNITLVRAEKGAVMTATSDVVIPRNGGFFAKDTKLTESFLIKDAATLQAFLTDAPNYAHGQFATIIKDIDLTGVEITPAESFLGTLDGRNHSIKNWTSNGTPLFAALSYKADNKIGATVKNLKFDSSCKLTPAFSIEAFGFLAKLSNAYTLIENCENHADINVELDATTGLTYFGTLVGISYGTVRNCLNDGDVTILVKGRAEQIRLGGLVGYFNVETQFKNLGGDYVYSLVDCVNKGNISYTVNGTSSNVFIGGVCAGSSPIAITADSKTKGTIKNCLNTGNVEYVLKNGGSMEDGEGSAGSGNYSNVGGVAGYVEGDVVGCVNGEENSTKGAVKVTVPTSISANAASRPAAGGVVGFSLFSVSDCRNYGALTIKGSFANAGSVVSGAGSLVNPVFGGVAALVGPLASAESYSVSNCHNYGDVNLDIWMNSTSGTSVRAGGIVGHSFVEVQNCTNNAPFTVSSCATEHQLAGIVGYGQGGVVSSTNNGVINVSVRGAAAGAQVRLGGVMGYGGKKFNANVNNSAITLTHPNTTSGIVMGGVVGYYNDGSTGSETTSGQNNGSLTVNSDSATNNVWFGGYAGYSNTPGEIKGVVNNAPLNFNCTANAAGGAKIGGVFGDVVRANLTDLKNTAKGVITITRLPSYYEVGGVVGIHEGAVTVNNCDNEAAINITATESTRTSTLRIGGVVGYNDKASTYKYCDNSGDITVNTFTSSPSYCYAHGIVSANDGKSNLALLNNTNTGDIYVNNNNSGQWRIAGICGYSGGGNACTGNTVKCNITLVGQSAKDHNVGGIMGYCAKDTYTDCTYEGTITTSGSQGTGANAGFVGGLTGRSNAGPLKIVGGSVNAKIVFGANTYGGVVTGDLQEDAREIILGTADKKTKIFAGSSVNGTLITNELQNNLIVGSRYTFTVTKTNASFVTE